jgi:nucleoside-diphosphate-sugar epimerase
MSGAAQTGPGRPTLVLVGGSGFLGRHLVDALRDRFRIHVLARRTERGVGFQPHPDVQWTQVDIADRPWLTLAFEPLRDLPRPLHVVHLAAHYDFTGKNHPEYQRTNVDGLRNVLDLCKELRPDRFTFASSVAACAFPPPGSALTEDSPPDGDHVYARSKRVGEAMVREYEPWFPSVIVRMAALFSDWCEYPPLYFFLRTWLSRGWNRRILGGHGESAIPYMHVRCAVRFYARLLDVHARLRAGEILIASVPGSVSHREVFEAATGAWYGRPLHPLGTAKLVARLGLWVTEQLGRWRAEPPFERAWMGRYIDQRLEVDGRRSQERVGWAPNPRLFISRRIPFLLDNFRADPLEWHARNLAAIDTLRVLPNLALYHLLQDRDEDVFGASMARFLDPAEGSLRRYRALGPDELRWAKRQLLLQLRNAIRTADRTVFRSYCRELGARRLAEGFTCDEVSAALSVERDVVLTVLRGDPRAQPLLSDATERVNSTFAAGVDEIQDVFEERQGVRVGDFTPGQPPGPDGGARPRPPP